MSIEHPSESSRPRLRLLPAGLPPLPAAVPLLRPDRPVTAREDALLTTLARRAQRDDPAARDLLWRAFSPKLEPALRRCGRMTWRPGWAQRNGRPWEQDDLRQEAWLVFAELIADWPGNGSIVPYVMAYFPWRLRSAMRRLGPPRTRVAPPRGPVARAADCRELLDAETATLVALLVARLSAVEADVLRARVEEGTGSREIARRLGMSRRTISRHLARIRRVAREVLDAS
jgi:RNA polymerase sigma factor (sigma-70 family)